MGYYGFKNYETWTVNNAINSSESYYNYFTNLAIKLKKKYRTPQAVAKLAEAIKDEIKSGNPLSGDPSLYSDLMNSAISEVDYMDIAEMFFDSIS